MQFVHRDNEAKLEIQTMQPVFPKHKPELCSLWDPPSIVRSMYSLIPRRGKCDKLVDIYFRYFEQAIRVLHNSSFRSEYAFFWNSLNEVSDVASRQDLWNFVPQLLSVLCIAYSCYTAASNDSDDAFNEQWGAVRACKLVEDWLSTIRHKHSFELTHLRTQALLAVAFQTISMPVETIWKRTGTLVRSALMMGLHHEPAESEHVPFFECQQRRRLWAAVVELDLQASLLCGMPMSVRAHDYTCKPPWSLRDEELEPNMPGLPVPLTTLDGFKSQPPFIILATTLADRLNTADMLRDSTVDVDAINLLQNLQELRAQHHTPALNKSNKPCESCSATSSNFKSPGYLLNHIITDIHLHRSIVAINRRFVGHPDHSLVLHARGSLLRSSMTILSHLNTLDPRQNPAFVEAIQRTMENPSEDFEDAMSHGLTLWNYFLNLTLEDIKRAALIICIKLVMLRESSTNCFSFSNYPLRRTPAERSKADEAGETTVCYSAMAYAVDSTISTLARNALRLGNCLKDIVGLAVVLGLVESVTGPTTSMNEEDADLERKRRRYEGVRRGFFDGVRRCKERRYGKTPVGPILTFQSTNGLGADNADAQRDSGINQLPREQYQTYQSQSSSKETTNPGDIPSAAPPGSFDGINVNDITKDFTQQLGELDQSFFGHIGDVRSSAAAMEACDAPLDFNVDFLWF